MVAHYRNVSMNHRMCISGFKDLKVTKVPIINKQPGRPIKCCALMCGARKQVCTLGHGPNTNVKPDGAFSTFCHKENRETIYTYHCVCE